MLVSKQKKWFTNQDVEGIIEELEEFATEIGNQAGNSKDIENRRFYEGMAVACKLMAMKLKRGFEYIDETFLNCVYENIKALSEEKSQHVFAREIKQRCSFCLQHKEPLVKGPFALICRDCLQFGIKVMRSRNV